MNLIALTTDQFDKINEKLDLLLSQITNADKDQKDWLTSKDAMKRLGVGQTTLWAYRKQGKIKARKINRKLYFNAQEVEQLIQNS